MKLSNEALKDQSIWLKNGFKLPEYNRKLVKEKSMKEPIWLHFGAGNIFRAFPAMLQQTLLNKGLSNQGISVVEAYDEEIIEKIYKPYDDLSVLATLKADGNIEKTVVGSVVEALITSHFQDLERLKTIFRAPSLQMVSFTITEKGYALTNEKGQFNEVVKKDIEEGPQQAKSFMGKLAALAYERYLAGALPIAYVSLDNCSHNGAKLYEALKTFANLWESRELVQSGFSNYIKDPHLVSFPWSMIDKITPRPATEVQALLKEAHFESVEMIQTKKKTFIAPFVNAEEKEYLVIEDHFPNGRPLLEAAGVIFTNKLTVNQVEKMKVCTCLNPLHTALAIFGCLLSYETICEEVKNPMLKKLIEKIGYEEGLPVVVDPSIIKPAEFLREVIEERLPNPFMPDSPWRIVTDTSQKMPIRFGETIKAYRDRPDLDVKQLTYIPLVIAGWCRYLMGINDEGMSFEMSSDPMLGSLKDRLGEVKLGQKEKVNLKPILSDEHLFGVDLYEVGLGEKIEADFMSMISKAGAVRDVLHQALV